MSVTEDTITDLLAGYLRDEGIRALTQISDTYPSGRSQPDWEIKSGGVFWGEAKWESSKWQGFGEARDYGQLPGASGSFLISYPDKLKQEGIQRGLTGDITESSLADYKYNCAFLRRDETTDMATLTLEEIPQWIKENTEERREAEADTDQVVDVLRQMARRLNEELQSAPEENLFRNVLGASTTDEEEAEAARETAGFLLINQITFYRVLSSNFEQFPELDADELDSPRDLSDYFERVLEKDYTPVFQFEIHDDLPQSSLDVLRDTIKSINGVSPERINHDVLGKVFHELIPKEARKKVAAYYTKNEAADILTHLAIDSADSRVIDPACGSGTLLASSYLRKKELLSTEFNAEVHDQFITNDLTGIDVMPFAAHLSCIHLALQAPIYETDEVNIGIADSTELRPGLSVNPLSFVLPESSEQRGLGDYSSGQSPDISEEKIEAGSTTLDAELGSTMELTTKDLVIMNPPFTRGESVARFSPDYKNKLKTRFDRRDQKGHLHGKMSYCSYFFFLADKFLEEGGRIAAVVPATVLNKKSDNGVRQMLVNEYDVEYVFAREDEPNYSEDTDLREVLIIARKDNTHDSDSGTAFVSHDGLDIDIDEIQTLAETTETGNSYNGNNFTLQKISLESLNVNNLFAPFLLTNRELNTCWEKLANGFELTNLESLDVGLIRGIGSNADGIMHVHPECSLNDPAAHTFGERDLFVLEEKSSDHVVARHRHTDETFTIPREDVAPNLRRYAGQKEMDLSDSLEYVVLNDNWDGAERYLELTDEDSIHYKWSDRVHKRRGHVALVRRVDLTAPGTHHLAYYSEENRLFNELLWVLPNATRQEGKILAAWFNSTFGWLQSFLYRVETRGAWLTWYRYIVKEYRVPRLSSLNEEDRERITSTFDDVKNAEAPSIYQQLALNTDPSELSEEQLNDIEEAYDGLTEILGGGFQSRRELDKAILDAGGVEQQDELLNELYRGLLYEIVSLKLMMD
ncbi:hypothetical protein DQW50_00400 [Halorubrum sp. 48-1-W]|uniref:HsdM family class I SAM-dependent methyltransferase n=1 Tax=Halorubrum sp. 48-1-W TaxID=2249761 RepID=UPI000DCDC334|nr:N-6 DNA methylase [Halorubrum sp. 48-1-W]RAW46889.1 hypothetical protein DQW50_00400 [Halorubrum sp. 48-1-W]